MAPAFLGNEPSPASVLFLCELMSLLFLGMSLVLHRCSSCVSLMFIIMFRNVMN